jgi:polysaccharide export outer membrane protein
MNVLISKPPMALLFSGLLKNRCIAAVFFCFGMIYLSSCVGTRPPAAYFSGGKLDTTLIQAVKIPDQLIQKGDIMSIVIYSDNVDATAIFNQAGGMAASVPSPLGGKGNAVNTVSPATGYLVDNNGDIRLHAIGVLHVEGLSRQQLEELITNRLTRLGVLTNPYCIIRFNNFKITILGEVRSPGVFTIPTEKASVLEAIAMAGDFTEFGLKNKVLLIRENEGKRSYANIDLTDPLIFSSPNFYLRQNDVLVVEPDKKKPTASDQRNLALISLSLAVVSTIAIVITLFR